MGSRTTVTLFDDFDGSTEGVRTVSIGLDRQTVELDLSEANYAKVRDFLTPYPEAGRKTGSTSSGSSRRKPSSSEGRRDDSQAIREWAEANGHQVSARGRIKKDRRRLPGRQRLSSSCRAHSAS
jgi:hypothetical protein